MISNRWLFPNDLQSNDTLAERNFLTSPTFKFTNCLHFRISRLQNTGLINYWIQRTYFNMYGEGMSVYELFYNPNTRLSTNGQELRLVNLTSVFILWGIGIGISTFVLIVELIYQFYGGHCQEIQVTQ